MTDAPATGSGTAGPRSSAPASEVDDDLPWPSGSPAVRCDARLLALHPVPACVQTARAHTTATLSAWGLDAYAPCATLIVSELVTNALRHAAPAAETDWSILLRLSHRDDALLCAVADPSHQPPILLEPGPDVEADHIGETGRGLYLVAAHSHWWGWRLREHTAGKWVRALVLPPAAAPR